MALTITQSLVSILDGAGATLSPANGATALCTPGVSLTFSLANGTSGINRWSLQFVCPSYPALHLRTFDWLPGMANSLIVPLPAEAIAGANPLQGVQWISVVSDGSGGAIPGSTGFLQTRGIQSGGPMQQTADYVIVAALPAYTNANGVLTGTGNAAVTSAMADGATPAVGDVFLLEQGRAAAAVDAGLYQLTQVGSGSAPFIAKALNFGTILPYKAEYLMSFRGTVFGGTTWVNTLAGLTNVVGTASFTFFPRQVTYTAALVAGVITAGASATTNAPAVMSVMSATLTQVVAIRRTANTCTATVNGYAYNGNPTAGGLGTGSASMMACVAAGTVNNADVSTMDVTLINPC